jgi:hypothetical protein
MKPGGTLDYVVTPQGEGCEVFDKEFQGVKGESDEPDDTPDRQNRFSAISATAPRPFGQRIARTAP